MLILEITSLSHSGEGIARHDGRVVFVPFALPGETVRVEIIEDKKNFQRARLVEILTPSADRVGPLCQHHFSLLARHASPACGGCQLQHLAYPAQVAYKTQQVIEQLVRMGGWAEAEARRLVRPTVPAPQPFGYRNQVQFSLTPEGQLGFKAASSNAMVPITECHLAAPALMHMRQRLNVESVPELERLTLRASAEDELIIFESDMDAPEVEIDWPVSVALLRPDGASMALAGRDYLVENIKGRAFKISAGSFFQVNTAVAEKLVNEVLAALTLRTSDTVLELYCGVGLFTAFIAPEVKHVIGIEAAESAVEDAAANLDEFENVEIYCAPAEDVLPTLELKPDVALIDPPRAGCAPAVLDVLLQLKPRVIVYVACDPATFARDAKRLAAGRYRLEAVQPFDMFPQTHHVECVARFVSS
ncbi:MAG: 23S rRNA (uracil(1939)-C(5))-methyltransferase RlmD [Anaerolineales bacterium]|nr:23S rRNA (uracil(1939)-C(5))-methyltransferase RlmD [Anaerolineales bacterium]